MTFNTKKEMVETLSKNKGISKVKAKEIIEDVLLVMEELIMDETHDGLDVHGLFKAEVKEIPDRERRNPKDGTVFIKKAHSSIKFKASSRIKKMIELQ